MVWFVGGGGGGEGACHNCGPHNRQRGVAGIVAGQAGSGRMGGSGRRDAALAVRVGGGGSREAEVGLLLRGQVHLRGRPNESGHFVAAIQQREVWVQRAEEAVEQLRQDVECVLQEGRVDQTSGRVPRHIQKVPPRVHVGSRRPHPRGPLAPHERIAWHSPPAGTSQPPRLRRRR